MRRPVSSLVVVVLLAAVTSVPLPAQAAPVFGTSDLDSGQLFGASGGSTSCVTQGTPSPALNNQPVPENGSAVTGVQTLQGTVTDGDEVDDPVAMSFSTSMSAVGRVTSKRGNPGTLSLVGSGKVDVTTHLPASQCQIFAISYVQMDYSFTTSKPGFLDVTLSAGRGGYGYAEVALTTVDGGPGFQEYALAVDNVDSVTKGRVLLAADEYQGHLQVDARYFARDSASASPKPAVLGVFRLLGERLAKPRGAGKKFTVLPAARACPGGKLKVKTTSNKGRSVQIDQVHYYVNDKLVKKAGNRGPGSSVRLKGPADRDVAVRAVTTLTNGKVIEARASYVACTV